MSEQQQINNSSSHTISAAFRQQNLDFSGPILKAKIHKTRSFKIKQPLNEITFALAGYTSHTLSGQQADQLALP